jgi:mRNA-degrading endonuclease toxin of MazEF toxin-antitoxin module
MNTEKAVVKRGEIYCADLSPVIGCELMRRLT